MKLLVLTGLVSLLSFVAGVIAVRNLLLDVWRGEWR